MVGGWGWGWLIPISYGCLDTWMLNQKQGENHQNGWFFIIKKLYFLMDDLGVFPYFWKHPHLFGGYKVERQPYNSMSWGTTPRPGCHRQHQDDMNHFSSGSRTKLSFATVSGRGGTPKVCH